jgi:hypothetical protein
MSKSIILRILRVTVRELQNFVIIFEVLMASIFRPEEGNTVFLHNAVVYLYIHKALQPRKPTSVQPQSRRHYFLCILIYQQIHAALLPKRDGPNFFFPRAKPS